MTGAAPALTRLLGARAPAVFSSAIMNVGLKAASFVSVPPHFAVGASWVVLRCADVAAIVPFCSHLREEGLKGVANTSFVARAAWTATPLVHVARGCSPPVRPPLGTTMANQVARFMASASDYVEFQAFLGIQL